MVWGLKFNFVIYNDFSLQPASTAATAASATSLVLVTFGYY